MKAEKKKELLIILRAWKKMLTTHVGWISRDEIAFKQIKELIIKSGQVK